LPRRFSYLPTICLLRDTSDLNIALLCRKQKQSRGEFSMSLGLATTMHHHTCRHCQAAFVVDLSKRLDITAPTRGPSGRGLAIHNAKTILEHGHHPIFELDQNARQDPLLRLEAMIKDKPATRVCMFDVGYDAIYEWASFGCKFSRLIVDVLADQDATLDEHHVLAMVYDEVHCEISLKYVPLYTSGLSARENTKTLATFVITGSPCMCSSPRAAINKR
jgi:hypothetical protein